MKTKHRLILAYLAIGTLFALYGWLWGEASHRSLPYHLGQGLVWPALLFPGLGKIIGTVILLAVLALVLMT